MKLKARGGGSLQKRPTYGMFGCNGVYFHFVGKLGSMVILVINVVGWYIG